MLAAGLSARMGGETNKLVEPVAGRALVAWVVDALLESAVAPIVVVTGYEAERVQAALAGRPCRFARHAGYREGMGSSLACGAQALLAFANDGSAREESARVRSVLVCVGDLPGLRARHVDAVLNGAASSLSGRAGIAVPTCGGRRGHPVCFGADWLPALARLAGDEGARSILREQASHVVEIELGDPGILLDIDTPEALAAARGGASFDPRFSKGGRA